MSYIDKLLGAYSLVVVASNRYGGGYAAYFATEDTAGRIQSQLTSGDSDYASLAYGVLGAEWYPFATGDTPLEALANLEKACERIDTMDFGEETVDYVLTTAVSVMFDPTGGIRREFDGDRGFAFRNEAAIRSKKFLALLSDYSKQDRAASIG